MRIRVGGLGQVRRCAICDNQHTTMQPQSNWIELLNLISIAVVTGLTVRLLMYVLKQWLAVEFPRRTAAIGVALIMGFIAGFHFARNLKTGLIVSQLLVGSNFVIVVTNHFFPVKKGPR